MKRYANGKKVLMMATKATHQLGDLSREEPALCFVYGEDGDDFIGCWAEGFGFFDVKFPKKTTRNITKEERERLKGSVIVVGDSVRVRF